MEPFLHMSLFFLFYFFSSFFVNRLLCRRIACDREQEKEAMVVVMNLDSCLNSFYASSRSRIDQLLHSFSHAINFIYIFFSLPSLYIAILRTHLPIFFCFWMALLHGLYSLIVTLFFVNISVFILFIEK